MWSKLQRKLYEVIDLNLNLQVHCIQHRGRGKSCINGIPRFWITLNGEVIFECLHQIMFLHGFFFFFFSQRPYDTDSADICGAVIRYVNAPVGELTMLRDRWGLFDILVAADRRIGKRRWPELYFSRSEAARKVLLARGFVPRAEFDGLSKEITTILDVLSVSNKALKSI